MSGEPLRGNGRERLVDFVDESNRIEGITRPAHNYEVDAHAVLLVAKALEVAGIEYFVTEVAARPLRDRVGLDVRVGSHRPPPGGPHIRRELEDLVDAINANALTPYEAHRRYESLHPFLDGNGRSGRAVWAWHMRLDGKDPFSLPFLHRWYYQSLDASRSWLQGTLP